MRVYVEPSPAGGFYVRAEGVEAPVSRHDTEDEAQERAAAYARGLMQEAAARRGGEERVRLRDGSQVIVRAVRPDDKPLFERGFERLSDRSRYQRFLSFRGRLTAGELAFFTELDHDDHDAVGAIDPDSGEGLGVARLLRLPHDRSTAEAAVTIIDGWQGRGLGKVLIERLCERAAARGVRRLRASLLASNRPMLALFEHVGEVHVLERPGVTLEIEVELSASDR
jgi:GNAT superfamily N-acetyltransferase